MFKRRHFFLLSICLTLCMLLTIMIPDEKVYAGKGSYVIVIDPGHDSYHARAKEKVSGIVEQSNNMAIAKSLKKQLQAYGFTVYLTHDGSCPSGGGSNSDCLEARTDFAKKVGCNLFVSIHTNASDVNNGSWQSTNGSAIYISTLYQMGLHSLARRISSNLSSYCSLSQRTPEGYARECTTGETYSTGVKQDYYTVLNNACYAGFPSILIEHGFMDNKHDANLIKNLGAYSFAEADCDAIVSWYNATGGYVSYSKKSEVDAYKKGKGSSSTSSNSSSGSKSSSSSGSASGKYGYVNYDFLNVRKGPGTGYAQIDKLTSRQEVHVLSVSDGWYRVEYMQGGKCKNGYVLGSYISLSGSGGSSSTSSASSSSSSSSASSSSSRSGYVNYKFLNVRSGAGTGYSAQDRLDYKDDVTVLSSSNGWYYVSYYSMSGHCMRKGYVKSSYITLK